MHPPPLTILNVQNVADFEFYCGPSFDSEGSLAMAIFEGPPPRQFSTSRERKFFVDDLLVRIHLIIEMTLVDRPCAMGV